MDQENSIKPQNKKLRIAGIATALIVLAGVGTYYVLSRSSAPESNGNFQQEQQREEVRGENNVQDEIPQNRNTVELFFIDLENRRQVGETIGCGDSLIAASRSLETADKSTQDLIKETLGLLFSEKDQFVGKGGLYNVFYQSDLKVDRVEVVNNTANVYLTGDMKLGGTCDDPRAQNQLEKTVTQFKDINVAKFFLNNQPLTFSQK